MDDYQDPVALKGRVIEALRTIYDPEIPVNIYDLGLIYEINTDRDGRIDIRMTLTAPACPVAGILPEQVRRAASAVEGAGKVEVVLVWQPPWGPDRMSEEAQLSLGLL